MQTAFKKQKTIERTPEPIVLSVPSKGISPSKFDSRTPSPNKQRQPNVD